jgi:hypothetical protein
MAFYFWTRTFGVLKNKAESYKFSVFPKVNIRKRSKKLTKCLVFNTPKWLFISGPGHLASSKNKAESYKFSCSPKGKHPKKT